MRQPIELTDAELEAVSGGYSVFVTRNGNSAVTIQNVLNDTSFLNDNHVSIDVQMAGREVVADAWPERQFVKHHATHCNKQVTVAISHSSRSIQLPKCVFWTMLLERTTYRDCVFGPPPEHARSGSGRAGY